MIKYQTKETKTAHWKIKKSIFGNFYIVQTNWSRKSEYYDCDGLFSYYEIYKYLWPNGSVNFEVGERNYFEKIGQAEDVLTMFEENKYYRDPIYE